MGVEGEKSFSVELHSPQSPTVGPPQLPLTMGVEGEKSFSVELHSPQSPTVGPPAPSDEGAGSEAA